MFKIILNLLNFFLNLLGLNKVKEQVEEQIEEEVDNMCKNKEINEEKIMETIKWEVEFSNKNKLQVLDKKINTCIVGLRHYDVELVKGDIVYLLTDNKDRVSESHIVVARRAKYCGSIVNNMSLIDDEVIFLKDIKNNIEIRKLINNRNSVAIVKGFKRLNGKKIYAYIEIVGVIEENKEYEEVFLEPITNGKGKVIGYYDPDEEEIEKEEIEKEEIEEEKGDKMEITKEEQQALATIYKRDFEVAKEIDRFMFAIVGQGTHPCAYIAMPKGIGDIIDIHDIDVHGGVTYEDDGLHETIPNKYYVIGWDYGHFGDFNPLFDREGKIYTLIDILDDIQNVVNQIIRTIEERTYAMQNADVTGY